MAGFDFIAAGRGVLAPSLVMLGSAGPASRAELTALTAAEQDRAAAFRRPADRDSYVAAHRLVRECAARLAGIDDPAAVPLVQCCPTCGGRDHGRPSVPGQADLYVSLSHSQGMVAAAAGWAPVGVDVELTCRRTFNDGLLGHALAPSEHALVRAADDPGAAFLRQWMRKEALIKVGLTTLGTMSEIDLSGLPLAVAPGGSRQTRFGRWHLLDWSGGAGAGLAAVSAQPLELVITGEESALTAA